ncbi:amidohydrolase family-domain-containing protein [Cladochytrium replicatum]|nr:amidohydrolase family-domain-containing protein [Cladochytrium replicatum]
MTLHNRKNVDGPSESSALLSESPRQSRRTTAWREPACKRRNQWIYSTFKRAALAVIVVFLLWRFWFSSLKNEANEDYYVVTNARVWTVEDDMPSATGFVVKDRKFFGVGEGSDLVKAHPAAKVIDLGGKTVTPGLVDSHAHLMPFGRSLMSVDIMGAKSLSEVRSRIHVFLDAHPDFEASGKWVVGRGWDQTKWPGGSFPVADDLDVDTRLRKLHIVLTRVDEHAIWVNRRVLSLVGKSADQPVEGGQVVRDDNGKPTGIFIDDAIVFVERVQPRPTEEDLFNALSKAISEMHRVGLTGVHDAGVPVDILKFYERAVESGRVRIWNYAMVHCERNQTAYCGDGVPPRFKEGKGPVRVGGVKLILDGALGSWGASMLQPYSDEPEKTGFIRIEPSLFPGVVREWLDHEFQVNVHAIGDRANKLVIDTFETEIGRLGRDKDIRLRIEHAQILRVEDIPRVGRLGILPSVQPTHCTSDMGYVEQRIGKRAEGAYVWKGFLETGVKHLPLGSDFPVERPDPLHGLYSAVTRAFQDGTSPHGPNGWFPSQKLSIQEALRGFTLSAAYAAFLERERGSIALGKYADFVVFDRDFVTATERGNPSVILDTKVLATFFEGNREYGSI